MRISLFWICWDTRLDISSEGISGNWGFSKTNPFAQNAFAELKAEGYIRYEDLPLETKEGMAISVEFVSNVYLVGDKKIIQCNIRDMTKRKRAEDALALACRKLNLMSGITRHDIMNQLTVLSGPWNLHKKISTNRTQVSDKTGTGRSGHDPAPDRIHP